MAPFIRSISFPCCLLAFSFSVHAVDLFVSIGNNAIEKFATDGSGASFASSGLDIPYGLALNSKGNLFAANFGSGTIEKFSLDGVGSVFASLGTFSHPTGMTFDKAGNLYVAKSAGSIVKITQSGVQSVYANTGMFQVHGIVFDSTGNLYVANAPNSPATGYIAKITQQGAVSTFAIGLGYPAGLAIDSSDNLYVSDGSYNTILKFTPSGSRSVFAGVSGSQGYGLSDPCGLAFDLDGNLYAANSGVGGGSGWIQKITPQGVGTKFATSSSQITNYIAVVPEPKSIYFVLFSIFVCGMLRMVGFMRNHQIGKTATD